MLTRRQAECLRFIESFIAEWSHAPTMREIAAALGVKLPCSAHHLVRGLRIKGYIEVDFHRSRSIKVIRPIQRVSTEYQRGFEAGLRAARAEQAA
jgi:repressor LexA